MTSNLHSCETESGNPGPSHNVAQCEMSIRLCFKHKAFKNRCPLKAFLHFFLISLSSVEFRFLQSLRLVRRFVIPINHKLNYFF